MHPVVFTIDAIRRIAYHQAHHLQVRIVEGQNLIFRRFEAHNLRAQVRRVVVFSMKGVVVF